MKIIKAIKDATTFLELHTNQSSQHCKIEAEEIFMFVFGPTGCFWVPVTINTNIFR